MGVKGLGYLISIVSVAMLGVVAWPRPDEPQWKVSVLLAGMAASIVGMALRHLSHRKEQQQLERAGVKD